MPDNESVTITTPGPAISTQASGGGPVGTQVTDTATLTGGVNPTGMITFTLFGPDNATCAGPAIFTDTAAVNGNGNYTSDPFPPPAPGLYRWVAVYGGDARYGDSLRNLERLPIERDFVFGDTGAAGQTVELQGDPARGYRGAASIALRG